MTRDLLYPVFLDISQQEEDKFWKYIFEDLAFGMCPYGTYINKGFLCCNFKGKEFNYKIDANDVHVCHKNVKHLLKNKLGLMSSIDRITMLEDFTKTENEIQDLMNIKWSYIKKKSIKDFLIENFIIEKKKEFCLDEKQIRNLFFYIQTGILFRFITSKDIVYSNGIIENIDGIEFAHENIQYKKNISEMETNVNKIKFIEKNCILSQWYTFLQTIKNKNLIEF
jgi:hypothetical protein